ncbi:low molecular weight phosphatase family protein [Candidatus Parcubacteria bacterium]|nr:low molecular weight phosphatase family protein [Candidatus Parcubacteria bacterium]
MKILFICKGNVGRSQIAEALFVKLSNNKAEAISAGTKISGSEQPIGELLPQIQEVLDVMNEEGIDVSTYVRKQLTEKMVEDSDKVIAIIEDTEVLPDYLTNSPKLIRWNVPDPKGKDITITRQIKDQIKELIIGLVKTLN